MERQTKQQIERERDAVTIERRKSSICGDV
jgi:hypothetical protein